MPAPEIEGVVMGALQRFLTDRSALLEVMPRGSAAQVQQRLDAAVALAKELEAGSTTLRLKVIADLVERVVMRSDAVDIGIRLTAVWQGLADSDAHAISVPA